MIKTNNMYYSAYLLNEGMNISNVEMSFDGKMGRTVVFKFNGTSPEIEYKLEKEYQVGQALTNIRGYLDALVTIRDIIHKISFNGEKKYTGEKITEGARNEQGRIAGTITKD